MTKPILCIGTYAETPYHIEKIGRNVYCIEELCYCLVHNAFLVDEECFVQDLFDWIEKECSLVRLSDELRSMAAKRCSLSALVGTLLDYVGYNTRKEIDKTEEILRENAGMDIYRKKLARADFLMNSGRYNMAFREYEYLLSNMPEMDRNMRAGIEHNEGVMFARLFLFDKAKDMFMRAYEDSGNRESYIQYLMAVRMELPDKEYVSYIAENEDAYEASLEIERRLKECDELYSACGDNITMRALSVYKAEGNMHEYYTQVGEMTEKLKADYRELVKET